MPELNIVVGTRLRDLDPRTNGRVVTVTAVTKKHAEYQAGVRKAKISLDRIFPFGSTRKSGYAVADPVSQPDV